MKQETLEEAAKNYAEEYKGEEQDPLLQVTVHDLT